MKYCLMIAFCSVLLTGTLSAQDQAPDTSASEDSIGEYHLPPPSPAPGLGLRDVGRVFLTLFLIVGLLYGVLRFLKKGWPAHKLDGVASSEMVVLGRLYLGSKKQLCLVELPHRVLVLGLTDKHISLLGQITDEQEILALKHRPTGATSMSHSFLQQLKNSMGRSQEASEAPDLSLRELEQSMKAKYGNGPGR